MNSKNPFLNPDTFESPQRIYLYFAARVIAFDEKPLEIEVSQLVYESRNNYQEYFNEPYQMEIRSLDWHSSDDETRFNLACNALLLWLMQGNVKAWGSASEREEVEDNPDPSFKHLVNQEIPKDFWDMFVDVSWYDCRASNHLGNAIKEFAHIEVSVPSLMAAIKKNLNTKPQSKGRPPKYNWDAFFTEMVLMANQPDGLPARPVELEKLMTDWCQNNWPEEPGISTIKEKISLIYQAIEKAKK